MPPHNAVKLLLTAIEAADVLSVSDRKLFDLTAPRGPIPVLRLPGRGKARSRRYAVADLQAWITSQTHNPAETKQ